MLVITQRSEVQRSLCVFQQPFPAQTPSPAWGQPSLTARLTLLQDKLGWEWVCATLSWHILSQQMEGGRMSCAHGQLHPRNPPGWDVTSNLPALRN